MNSTISVKILYFTHILAISLVEFPPLTRSDLITNSGNDNLELTTRMKSENVQNAISVLTFSPNVSPLSSKINTTFSFFFFIWKNIGKQTTSHESTVQWLSMQPLTLRFPPDTKLQLYLVLSPVPLHFQI